MSSDPCGASVDATRIYTFLNELLPAKLFGHHMFRLTTFLVDTDPME